MSILLDALRKSEHQKHRGKVPTIHSSGGLETRSGSRLKVGQAALLVLPVLIVFGWYGWKSDRGTAGTTMVTEQAASSVEARRPEMVSRANGMQAKAGGDPVAPADASGAQPEPADSRQATSPLNTSSARTPVETFSAPEEQATAATEEPRPGITPEPGEIVEAATSNTAAQATPARAAPQEESPVRDFREPVLDAISYWRLPQTVRDELGELRISVLVFAEDPDSRFLIMNGRRLEEGDEPRAGLVLREISREGAVFSYRLYRFLVSR